MGRYSNPELKTRVILTDSYADVTRTLPWWLGVAAAVSLRICNPARYEEVYGAL